MDCSNLTQRDFSDAEDWNVTKGAMSNTKKDEFHMPEPQGKVPEDLGISQYKACDFSNFSEIGHIVKLKSDLCETEMDENRRKALFDDAVDERIGATRVPKDFQGSEGSTNLELYYGTRSATEVKDAQNEHDMYLYTNASLDEKGYISELCSGTSKGKLHEFVNIQTIVLDDVNDPCDAEIETLCYAIEKRDKGIIQLQLGSGVDVTAKNSNGKSPLECAIEIGDQEIIKALTYRKIIVPEVGSSLFWACSLAYLIPSRYDDRTFREKLEKLFGCLKSMEEFKKVKDKIQSCCPSSGYMALRSDLLLRKLVNENLSNKLFDEISSLQEEFEKSITLNELFYKNENYVKSGAFQEEFCKKFSTDIDQYGIDINKCRPDMCNAISVKLMNEEIHKIPDQTEVNKFIFSVYLKRIRAINSWDGKLEMQAISHMLRCKVHVFSDGINHYFGDEEYIDQIQLFKKGESSYEFGLIRAPVFIEAIKKNEEQNAKSLASFGIDDVNYESRDGWTSLHFAAQSGYAEIIHCLLAQGADPCVKNSVNQSALDVAETFARDDVVSVLKKWNEGESKAVLSSGRSSPLEREQDEEKEIYDQVDETTKSQPTYERFGESGLSGQIYEIDLAMFFLLQGLAKKESGELESFYLATNLKEAGDFDDVVFRYKYKDKIGNERSKVIFLQAKLKINPDGADEKITFKKFFAKSGKKKDFTLRDYFRSYLDVKYYFDVKLRSTSESAPHEEDPIIKGSFEELDCDFVIYTNALSSLSNKPRTIEKITAKHTVRNDWDTINEIDEYYIKKVDLNDQDDILYLDGKAKSNHYYEIVLGGNKEDEIIKVLKSKSSSKKEKEDISHSLESSNRPGGSKSENEREPRLRNKKPKCSHSAGGDSGSEQQGSSAPVAVPVTEKDIEKFLRRLKLFVGQPGEEDFSAIIKQKIQGLYRVEENDAERIFCDVREQIEKWWKEDDKSKYLTEKDNYFEECAKISISFDLKKQCEFFVGRKKELSELYSKLNAGRFTVISQKGDFDGVGGIGKTELAIRYVAEYSHDYDDNVIWINAADYKSLLDSFSRLAQDKLKIKAQKAIEQESYIKYIRDEIYKYFEKKKCLFIFDNATKCATPGSSESVIDEFLPHLLCNRHIHILITSRKSDWKNLDILTLDVFTKDEAQEFICRALCMETETEESTVKQLSDDLNYYPLALRKAVEYIREENKKLKNLGEAFLIKNYLEMYKEEEKKLNEQLGLTLCDKCSVANFICWKITLEKIKEINDGNRGLDILDVMAYFAPTSSSTRIFFERLIHKPEEGSSFQLLKRFCIIALQQGEMAIYRATHQVILSCIKRKKDSEVLRLAILSLSMSMQEKNSDSDRGAVNVPFKVGFGSLDDLRKVFSDFKNTSAVKRSRCYSV